MSELRLTPAVYEQIVGHCFEAYPLEGCGLVASDLGGRVVSSYGLTNSAGSARLYELDSAEFMAADQDADSNELIISGVFHSHTHTDAYPSETDVAKAAIAEWHYILISFAGDEPVLRSFRIVDGNIAEESVVATQ